MTIVLRTKRQSGPVGSDNKPVYELEKEGIYLLVVHVAAVRNTHPVNNDNDNNNNNNNNNNNDNNNNNR